MVQAYCSGYYNFTLPNKEGSWVLGLQGSVAKILQNPTRTLNGWLFQDLPICLWPNDNQPEMYSV